MHYEALILPNPAQGSTLVFPVAAETFRHQRNASKMLDDSANSTKLSKYNFGVGQSSKMSLQWFEAFTFSIKYLETIKTMVHMTAQMVVCEK